VANADQDKTESLVDLEMTEQVEDAKTGTGTLSRGNFERFVSSRGAVSTSSGWDSKTRPDGSDT
jgi:hypothetical protein